MSERIDILVVSCEWVGVDESAETITENKSCDEYQAHARTMIELLVIQFIMLF